MLRGAYASVSRISWDGDRIGRSKSRLIEEMRDSLRIEKMVSQGSTGKADLVMPGTNMFASKLRVSDFAPCPTMIPAALALVAGALCGLVLTGTLQAAGTAVSQKGRMFHPGNLVVGRGDTITFVNDDSDLLHHVFVESDSFSFDSGDQEPGSRTPVTFTERGTFQVLCGIHPKMKLVVRVD